MHLFTLAVVFALGATIGSFLNVVILRRGTGMGLLRSSFCFTCRTALRFYELVPIFSFIALRGRCHSCRAKIHFQYPLVEALAGVLFVIVWLREFGGVSLLDLATHAGAYERIVPHLILSWATISTLLVIAAYDLRHKMIPDLFVYVFIVLAFLSIFPNIQHTTYNIQLFLNHIGAGVVFFLLFAALWLVSRGKWMGFCDAKLVAGIGIFLGASTGAAALILYFWTGALVSVALLSLKRFSGLSPLLQKLTMKSEIPFAPFLVFGTLAAYFFQLSFWDIAAAFAR